MPSFSSVGRTRIAAYMVVLLCNLIVFSLAAHVNSFHGFFYVADQLPFVLSIFTFLILTTVVINDFRSSDPLLSKPVFELTWLGLLAIFWLAFSAFSSSRWRYVQAADCGTIPAGDDFAAVTTWCKEIQALRSFVWIEWALLSIVLVWLLRFTIMQASHGNTHVWRTSLARYTSAPKLQMQFVSRPVDAFGGRASGFMPTQQPPPLQAHYQNRAHWQAEARAGYDAYAANPAVFDGHAEVFDGYAESFQGDARSFDGHAHAHALDSHAQ